MNGFAAFIVITAGCVLFALTLAALEAGLDHLPPLLARRKVSRAQWRHLQGVRGTRGRRAWRRLARTTRSSVSAELAHALWQSWIREPDDDRWELVSRWRPEEALADLLAAATAVAVSTAAEPGGGPRAPLAAFCARHGLAPDEPAERVRFYVLTGQAQRWRALDPDGTLLAAAYRTAPPQMRAALREDLAGEGDLDVLRLVVAGSPAASARADMTTAEREFLTARLAAHRDWARLWDLAKELPVIEAAAAAALIDHGWWPERQRDRELHAMLTEIAPHSLRYARAALSSDGAVRIGVPGRVVAGALSPGGQRLAVATVDEDPAVVVVSRHGLPGGRLIALHRIPRRGLTSLVYASAGEVIAVDAPASHDPLGDATRIYQCAVGHRARLVAREDVGAIAATAFRQGFVIVSARGFLHAYRGRGGGKPPAPEPWLGWALSAPAPCAGFSITRAHAAADLASGRIAVTSAEATGDQLVVLQARRARSVHEVTRIRLRAMATGICFHDREHVIVAGPDYVERLRVSPRNNYQQTAARPLRGARDLVLVNGRDEVCALDDSGAVAYFSASSLGKAREPRELAGLRGTALWGAPGNVSHALGGDGTVHVVTRELLALQELADRPMTAWRPADAATVARAEVVVARCPAVRPLHGLLAACLDHKFGDDVGCA